MAYAVTTEVPVERTRAEIEKLLQKFKCTQFVTGTDSETAQAMVQFRAHNRIVRFVLQLPRTSDQVFKYQKGSTRKQAQASDRERRVDQATRSKWRALLLVVKAKLESVESQIATFEEEFMAHIVMPGDKTVGEIVTPMIARAYESGQMPRELLALPSAHAPNDGDVVEGGSVNRG